jgi:hypothetical protein
VKGVFMTLNQAWSQELPGTAICVQRFDDSRRSAIHTTYRISLRSSSMHEPRDPPLKVVLILFFSFRHQNGLIGVYNI